jgi:O-antigen ligase
MKALRTTMLWQARPQLRYPAEFFWLLALVFFLPLFEAPKNLCWAGYVLTWLYDRARAREWGGPWDRGDSLIALWIASAYLVSAFAGIHRHEWGGANDILRYGSVLWLVKRSRYDERALLWILGVIIAATLITLLWGYWRLFVAKTHVLLGLNSVGHVNHSAIYIAIVYGVALSVSIAYWKRVGLAGKAASVLVLSALIISVFVTMSRGAAVPAVLFVIALAAALRARGRNDAVKGALVALLGTALAIVVDPGVLNKTVDTTAAGIPMSYRDRYWLNALVEWREFPAFGVGMGNFDQVDLEQLQEWNRTQNWTIRPSAEGMAPHAHSIYFNTLAERGLIGFGVLMAVLLASGWALLRGIPPALAAPLDWALFGAALSAWLVTIVGGLVNTTLHHEHGILSVLLFGLWLAHRGPNRPDQDTLRP